MAHKNIRNLLIIMFLGILMSFNLLDDDKDKILIKILNQTLQTAHFKQVDVNDDFSAKVFDFYIKQLDYNKRFFTQQDITDLEKYKYLIDDQINSESLEFFNVVSQKIKQRIDLVTSIYPEYLSEPIDFNIDETIEMDSDKKNYAKDEDELKAEWRKIIKYSVLDKIYMQLKIQEDALEKKDTTVKIKDFATIERESRESVMKTYKDWKKRMTDINREDRFSEYLSSIAYTYDPHSEYYAPKEKDDFDISISGKLEGIGATLQQQDGYVKVINIVIGSPCWKQGELEVNDIILKVAQADGEPVSIVDMRLDEAVRLIRGAKGSEVRLTIKKIDGTIKTISIIRDIVMMEETYAKSIIVTDKDKKVKIAYIYLPVFYVDFENKDGRHCSEDIKKELIKIKDENVDGVIFDVRDNGGGSLQDVVDMAGLFIKDGAIVQVKSRYGSATVYKDTDKNIYYDGNLVVLVNTFSASASEILAAAIQDYDRGIVIGSTSTFGKGTVQRFVDFDNFVPGHDEIKPLGVLKLTTNKFYRINGGATQLKGVIPDIIVPDTYKYIETGEKELDNVLEWDQIANTKSEMWINKYNENKIIEKSNKRISSNENFKQIEENAKRLKKDYDSTLVTLNLEKYKTIKKIKNEEVKKFNDIGKTENSLSFEILKADVEIMKTDSALSKSYTNWQKELKKDITLEEAINVLIDMKK